MSSPILDHFPQLWPPFQGNLPPRRTCIFSLFFDRRSCPKTLSRSGSAGGGGYKEAIALAGGSGSTLLQVRILRPHKCVLAAAAAAHLSMTLSPLLRARPPRGGTGGQFKRRGRQIVAYLKLSRTQQLILIE